MKTADLAVEVRGMRRENEPIVALLAPADPMLTIRYSCYLNPIYGSQTTFRYLPPGTYRLFIIDEALKSDVAGYAPHFPDFLKDQALPLVVAGEGGTKVMATHIDANTVKEAIRRAASQADALPR